MPLVTLLGDESGDVRLFTARALGKIGGREAIRYLVPLLHDEFDEASREAALALDRLEWIPTNEDQTIAYYLAKWEWKKVEKFGSKAVDQLLVLLENCGWHRKGSVAWLLGMSGDKRAFWPLLRTLWEYRHSELQQPIIQAALLNLIKINLKNAVK